MTAPRILLVALMSVAFAGDAFAGTLYTVHAKTKRLYSIDTDSLALTDIGALGVDFAFGGLAYDSNSDTLYMVGGFGNRNLYTVDRTTGAATLVGSHGVRLLFGLAYDTTNDILYGGQFDGGVGDGLYQLNTSTGAANLVGSTGIGTLGGLGYDSTRDQLVGVEDGEGDLYEINRADATSTFLFNGPRTGDTGLTYDSDADLFWNLDYSADLRSYDPTSGFADTLHTNIGSTTWDGLAFVSSNPVPEPSSFALFAFGALGIAWYRRRRSH